VQPTVAFLRGSVVCHDAGGPVDPLGNAADQGRELFARRPARACGQRRVGEKVVQCV
jgi:hypothetical protein